MQYFTARLVTRVGRARKVIINLRWQSRRTAIDEITNLRTVTENTVATEGVVRGVENGICGFITAVDCAIDTVIRSRWRPVNTTNTQIARFQAVAILAIIAFAHRAHTRTCAITNISAGTSVAVATRHSCGQVLQLAGSRRCIAQILPAFGVLVGDTRHNGVGVHNTSTTSTHQRAVARIAILKCGAICRFTTIAYLLGYACPGRGLARVLQTGGVTATAAGHDGVQINLAGVVETLHLAVAQVVVVDARTIRIRQTTTACTSQGRTAANLVGTGIVGRARVAIITGVGAGLEHTAFCGIAHIGCARICVDTLAVVCRMDDDIVGFITRIHCTSQSIVERWNGS